MSDEWITDAQREADRVYAERRDTESREWLESRGWIVRRPEAVAFPVTSRREGALDAAPFRVVQVFDVKVGDRIARVERTFSPTDAGVPAHVFASIIVGTVTRMLADELRGPLEAELRWIGEAKR